MCRKTACVKGGLFISVLLMSVGAVIAGAAVASVMPGIAG